MALDEHEREHAGRDEPPEEPDRGGVRDPSAAPRAAAGGGLPDEHGQTMIYSTSRRLREPLAERVAPVRRPIRRARCCWSAAAACWSPRVAR